MGGVGGVSGIVIVEMAFEIISRHGRANGVGRKCLGIFFSRSGPNFGNPYYRNVSEDVRNAGDFFRIFRTTNKGEKIHNLSLRKSFALLYNCKRALECPGF